MGLPDWPLKDSRQPSVGKRIRQDFSLKLGAICSSAACQTNSPKARIADSNSKTPSPFSSTCTTKRFPSSRGASAIQIVRPLEQCLQCGAQALYCECLYDDELIDEPRTTT